MKKTIIALVVLATVGGAVFAYYRYRQTPPKFSVTTAAVTRGDVVDKVGATGTLQAVTTVQVGTQVSGTIQSLYADFNSLVKKGQVLARLDPSLFETQIEQAKANLIRAQADLERLRVSLDDAKTKLARARELSGRQLLPKSDLDTAEVNVRSAEAQIRSSEAQVTQAQASLSQNQVNLEHTVISAPIDGLVISRSVDVGQTVAASMQAPTLFILAADLTKMQVVANLDESDVGRIRPGQQVSFRVDAYPAEDFIGKVSQVRLEPKVQQNVVTYATVIDVPNNELKLKPGMTANVNIEIARSANVLRVPNAALRFRPTNDMYAAIGQTPPEPGGRGGDMGGIGGMRRGGTDGPTEAVPGGTSSARPPALNPPAANDAQPRQRNNNAAPATGSVPSGGRGGSGAAGQTDRESQRREGQRSRGGRGGFPGDPSAGGGNRFADRNQNLSPEEREQMMQRMRARGFDPSTAGGGRGRGGARANTPAVPAPTPERPGAATTIDALFGPLPRVESNGRVWLYAEKQLRPTRLRLGISDGQVTEVIDGDVTEGQEVVTNITTGTGSTRPAASAFPFPGPGGGFGGPGGGNRGGGGGGRGGGR